MSLDVSSFHDAWSGTLTYVVSDPGTRACAIIALFMPDCGTARCDFPGGDASTLYQSIRRLLMLAPETRAFVGHDYGNDGRRAAAWQTTVHEQRAANLHLRDGVSEEQFVFLRTARDRTLAPSKLFDAACASISERRWRSPGG